MTGDRPEIVLARHGETEWSLDGRHTGTTDIPLTDNGRRQAEALGPALAARGPYARVIASPLGRAQETARLAGFGDFEVSDELREWDYGEYEGVTTAEIRADRPDWLLWRDGCPGGESAADVGARVDRVIAELREGPGPVAVFAHGHLLRVFGARWAGLPPQQGAVLFLTTGTLSELGWEREVAVLRSWNAAVA